MALFNWNQKIIYIHTYIYTYIQIAYTRVEWVWTIWWQERVECLLFFKKCPFEVFISHRNWSLVVFFLERLEYLIIIIASQEWKLHYEAKYCHLLRKMWWQKKNWIKSLYKIFSYFEIVIPSSHFRILTLFSDHWVSSNPKKIRP